MLVVAAWGYLTPAYLSPDENVHVGRAQKIAETGRSEGGERISYASSEQAESIADSGSDYVAAQPVVKPIWDRDTWRRWVDKDFNHAERSDASGLNPANTNPPVYYLLASVPYKLFSGSDLFTRVIAMRGLGLLFVMLLMLSVWHLAAALMPGWPLAPFTAAAVVGLQPMIGFIEGSVNPDAAMYALWALVVLAGVKALQGSERWLLGMLGAFLLAMGVKYQSVSLLPAVLFVLGVAAYRRIPFLRPGWPRAGALIAVGVVATVAFVLIGKSGAMGQQIREAFTPHLGNAQPLSVTIREFPSYLIQFYFGPQFFLHEYHLPGFVNFWETIWQEFWGAFSWHEVRLADGIYITIMCVFVPLLALAVRAIVVAGRWRRNGLLLVFLALPAVTLFLGLHWTDYKLLEDTGDPFIQGRYFLPLVPLVGLVAAAAAGPGLSWRPRWQPVLSGVVVALMVLLQFVSLGTSMERFYA